MKVAAAFTVMLVATAPVASAEPKQQETSGRVSYTDKGSPASDPARPDGEWIQLATPTPAKHGTEFVVIGKEQGDFSQLRIAASSGRVVVQSVRVYYDDGQNETLQVGRPLDARGAKEVIVPLQHKGAIDRVVVRTDAGTDGAYAIYGSSLPAGGAVAGR